MFTPNLGRGSAGLVPASTALPACVAMREGLRPISDAEAAHILKPYVEEAVRAFQRLGAVDVARIEVEVTSEAGCEGRHFAACSEEGDLILLAPELALLPEQTIRAIVHHEFGHSADFLYPASWVMTRAGLRLIPAQTNPYEWVQGTRRSDGSMPPPEYRLRKGATNPLPEHMQPVTRRMMADWRARSAHVIETDADALAETALGSKIGYAGPCRLQTVGEGVRPRPAGLR